MATCPVIVWLWFIPAHIVWINFIVYGTKHQAGLETSSAFRAALTPGTVAPAVARGLSLYRQVVLILYPWVWLLADELNDEGFRGGTLGMEELWGQVTLRAMVIVHNRASYLQRSAEVDCPVPIQVILPSHVLDSKEVSAGLNLLNSDACGSHRDYEDLIVTFGEAGHIKSALHTIAGAAISSTLQALVFLLGRFQHVITANSLANSLYTNIPLARFTGSPIYHCFLVPVVEVLSLGNTV